MDTRVKDEFLQWIRDTDGSIGEVEVTRGKIHDCLGVKLDHSVQGQVSIYRTDCIKSLVEGFPKEHLQGKVASPWNENPFKVHKKSPKLDTLKAELFHTATAQGLYVCKRARPDIRPAIAYLTT